MPASPAITRPPSTERELDELLSQPTRQSIDAVGRLGGDLLLLGAGGKMGPSLARLAKRSMQEGGVPYRVLCVSRWSDKLLPMQLQQEGITTIACDLLDRENLKRLPDAPNILYLAGFKFGATGAPHHTWAMNCYLAGAVAERFCTHRIVALSTGNVYPRVPVASGGATEATEPDPVGEYAQSCLGRERLFEYVADKYGTRIALIRLNYATDLRYGVLLDVAQRVADGTPVPLEVGYVNTIWQGDANTVLLQAFDVCSSPPTVLNLTGPEIVSVREAASHFGNALGRQPAFTGVESDLCLISNASLCHSRFGSPRVSVDTLAEWTAEWVRTSRRTLGKPTHFEAEDGKY